MKTIFVITLTVLTFVNCKSQAQDEKAFLKNLFTGSLFTDEMQKNHKQSLEQAKIVYLPKLNCLFLWHKHMNYNENYYLFDLNKNQLVVKSGVLPAGWEISKSSNFTGYCYLPELNSILLSSPSWSYQKEKKKKAVGWLLNTDSHQWQPVKQDINFSHVSSSYQDGGFQDGERIPLWNQTIFDPVNHEALLVGGGGVWGTVVEKPEKVNPGDWVWDKNLKQIRRIKNDENIETAFKWYPSNCGTWLFSQKTKNWSRLEQPLSEQPSGRFLHNICFDEKRKQFLLFGGDDLANCLNDTWAYKCETKKWQKIETKTTPDGIAAGGMIYDKDRDLYFLFGGYYAGWNESNDIWAFNPNSKEWSKLKMNLPDKTGYASCAKGSENRYFLQYVKKFKGNASNGFFIFELDLSKISTESVEFANMANNAHCENWTSWKTPVPTNWPKSNISLETRESELKNLPANTWVKQTVPLDATSKDWGITVYDSKTHCGFSWGGGHSQWPGAEVNIYSLLENRWFTMNDTTNFNPIWLHGMVAGPPGVSFGGWSLLPSHARKSYGVDPVTDSVVLYSGDVFDIKNNCFQRKISNFPSDWRGPSNQISFVTAKDGLYAYYCQDNNREGVLLKANVKEGKWDTILIGGENAPKPHMERCAMVYDSKNNQLIYVHSKEHEIYRYDLNMGTWLKDDMGDNPKVPAQPDFAYLPELNSIISVCPLKNIGQEYLFLYNLDQKKWYYADYLGDVGANNIGGLSATLHFDSKYNVVIRFYKRTSRAIGVNILRLDLKTLKLRPFLSEKEMK